ncbi:MAG: hypothetical protein GF383_15715, partial [Candidatus Lokiarchaeota archaeon]|nr:hypothetical protein [Candidatus Lokiarchaeota archaeon]MBD3343034.1 hypothetical protein [Candidatus Lokiarchaeota archaeon]
MKIASAKDLLATAESLNPIQAKAFICKWVVDNEVNPKRNTILEELSTGDLFAQDLAIIALQRIKDYKKIVEILLTTSSQTVQKHATRSLIMVDPPPSMIRAFVLELSNRMLSYLIHYIILKKKKEIAAAIFPLLVENFYWNFATKLIAFVPKAMVEEYFLLLSHHLDYASESILYKNYQDVFLKFVLEKLKESKSEDQLDLVEKQLRNFITPLLRYSEQTEEIETFYKSYVKGTSLERFSSLYNKLWKEELTKTFPQFFPDSRSGPVLPITLEAFHKFFNNSSIYTIWNASPEYPLEFKNLIYRCAILDGKPEVINFYSNEPEVVFRQFDNLMPKILMKWDEYFKGTQVPKEFEKGFTEYEVKHNQLANIKMYQVPLCFVNKYAEELYLLLKEKPELSKNRGFTIDEI